MSAGLNQELFVREGSTNVVPAAALLASFRQWISIELAFYAQHMRSPAVE